MSDLFGKVILITGGLGGIGVVTGRKLSDNGATIILVDRYWDAPSIDYPHSFFLAHGAQEKGVEYAVQEIVKKFGKIDVLFNNCGIGANFDYEEGRPIVCRTALDMDSEDFNLVMDFNFKSAVWFTKHAIPHMPKSDSSCIINSSSIWSRGKLPYALPYAVSKSALSVAAMNWAYQFAPVRSVSLVMGGIDTPMLRTNPNGIKEVSEQTLLKRAGTPEEIAEAVLFVIRCRYITATEIVIDGGSFNR